MKLLPKIVGIGIVGLLVAILIGGTTLFVGEWISRLQEQEYKYRAFRTEIINARLAHMNWLRNISETIIAKKPDVTVSTDGTKCAFGIWYYSDGQKAVTTKSEELQKMFRNIDKPHLHIHELGGEFMEKWNAGDHESAIELFNEKISPQGTSLLKNMADMADLSLKEIEEIHAESTWILENQTLPTLIALVIGILILIPYSYLTARGIVKPIGRATSAMQMIANDGDVNFEIPPADMNRKDEIGNMAHAVKGIIQQFKGVERLAGDLAAGNYDFQMTVRGDKDTMNRDINTMLDQVNAALREISENVLRVTTGSGEVSNAAQSLSDGSQKVAASLEEITASMNEISSQTRKNAENAGQARDLAQQTDKAAADGQKAMQEMTGAMELISRNSSEIQRVIKVIDDIAFQTNLLALNAAVEAARAGQHGKGFAVVAEEVRNLAARSAKAAQETSDLIARDSLEVEKGSKIAARTAEALNTIVEQIKETSELVAGIALASDEQAQGVGQITIGLQQIDAVTQQNTAAAEESASAANEMSSMATSLQGLVGQFKLRG